MGRKSSDEIDDESTLEVVSGNTFWIAHQVVFDVVVSTTKVDEDVDAEQEVQKHIVERKSQSLSVAEGAYFVRENESDIEEQESVDEVTKLLESGLGVDDATQTRQS